jgi:hypothetical protein
MTRVHTIDRGTKDAGASNSGSTARRSGLAFLFVAIGALSFWVPDISVHMHAGPHLDSWHAWAITLFSPAMFLLAYAVARRFALKQDFKWLGPAMLLGAWLTGGLFMTLSAMMSGSDFMGGTGVWRLVVIFISVIPIVTFVLAASDGSLFALLAITVGGLLIQGFRSSVALWRSAGAPSNATFERSASQHEHDRSTAA